MFPGGEEHTSISNDLESQSPLESSLRRDTGRTLLEHYKNGEKGQLYLGLLDASNSPVIYPGLGRS